MHGVLHLRGHAIVERLDLRPDLTHFKDFASRRVRACNPRRGGTGLLLSPDDEGRAHPVHDTVGGRGGNDFAAQAVAADGATEAAAHRLGKVSVQFLREVGVLRHVRLYEMMAEPDLAIGEQYGKFGARQTLGQFVPFRERLLVREELYAAIEIATAFKLTDEVLVLRQRRETACTSSVLSA